VTDFVELKQKAHRVLRQLARDGIVADAYHNRSQWYGSYPFSERTGVEEITEVWAALRSALPDLERRDEIFVAGASKPDQRVDGDPTGRPLVATMGVYQGVMRGSFCGIPPTYGVVSLRFCEVHCFDGEKIVHSYMLWDLADLMWQAGCWPMAPALGAEGAWRGPATADGVRLTRHEAERGAQGFDVVMAMHAALGDFDGKDLGSMDHGPYWTDDFMWYGPGGIGTTRGMEGFRAHHQIPFLTAFPDRKGSGHYVRIADGDYVVTGGWPSVTATHTGEWLGVGATGNHIDMRVMDFYRLADGKIAENWVPIDVLWILRQMGVDVLERMKHRLGEPRLTLPTAP